MRKVKDAKDLTTNELIYFKGHAKATYMSDGTTVEDAINNIEVGTGPDLSEYATKEELNSKQDTITDLETIRQGAAKGVTSVQQGALSTVATSGSYNDLTNKPTIPNAVTESTVSGWGFTKNTGTYVKPSAGIPKTDLASDVQTSLGKADTALQTETYKGTITGVSANGTSVSTSGVANIPAASTSAYGVTKLSSSTSSTSTSLAATASAVKSAYDLANGRQEKLISGTNIKTINGTSILGSGNITISSSDSPDLSNYYTKDEIDGVLGDINSVLESIIGGGGLITFTIEGVEYQAEDGMTWEEWVDSEYNIDNFYEENGLMSKGFAQYLKNVQGGYVAVTDKVIANYNYSTGV